ncbi:Radical S-adenosyl methionine domain-containing protein 2 [Geodia barretti]|nr:Radical S-adenosyl methionine domain-containing protein 2 [Geodia barretti]
MPVAQEELKTLLTHSKIQDRNIPILLLANKMDIRGSLTAIQCSKAMDVDLLAKDRPYHICSTNALTGDGLEEAVQWLSAISLPQSTMSGSSVDCGDAKARGVTIPQSVNYHFTRQCNYHCGFCFHTAKTSFVLPIDEAKHGLDLLRDAGMEKINFSGGEPFVHKKGEFLGELVHYCKNTLQLPSVTIVSNGSLITEEWFRKYGESLDILAISCDSFDESTNSDIGRQQGSKNHLVSLTRVRQWCRDYKVAFKVNTVVNTYNWKEDMSQEILQLDPVRWKVFQCLLIEGENVGPEARRNAESFVITDEQFKSFLDINDNVPQLVPESNTAMRDSYLILDEYVLFLIV